MVRALLLVTLAGCGRLGFGETSPPSDGATDASADAPGDTTLSCGHTFCDDFDRNTPLDTGWDRLDNTGAAILELDGAPPEGFFTVELPAPALEGGFLVKNFAPPVANGSVRIAFDIEYSSADPSLAEIDMIQLQWDTPPAPCTSFGFFLVRDGAGTGPFNLQETYGGCGGNENTALEDLDNLPRRRIEMIVTLGAIGGAQVRVEIDGVPFVDKVVSHAVPPSPLTLRLGGGAVRDMSAPWKISYDNLEVDVQ